jgi:hypothetical protein
VDPEFRSTASVFVISVGTEEWTSMTCNGSTPYRPPRRQGGDVACSSELACYQVPDRWYVGPLPRNAMGKAVRTEIVRLLMGLDVISSPTPVC